MYMTQVYLINTAFYAVHRTNECSFEDCHPRVCGDLFLSPLNMIPSLFKS